MIRAFLLAAAGFVILPGCGEGDAPRGQGSSTAAPEDAPAGVYLRLRNTSGVSFDNIVVSVGEPIEFGALPAHSESEYLPADGIYSHAYIEATSAEGSFGYQPIDYTGETRLSPGYYTYGLSIMRNETGEGGGWLDIQLFRDRASR